MPHCTLCGCVCACPQEFDVKFLDPDEHDFAVELQSLKETGCTAPFFVLVYVYVVLMRSVCVCVCQRPPC